MTKPKRCLIITALGWQKELIIELWAWNGTGGYKCYLGNTLHWMSTITQIDFVPSHYVNHLLIMAYYCHLHSTIWERCYHRQPHQATTLHLKIERMASPLVSFCWIWQRMGLGKTAALHPKKRLVKSDQHLPKQKLVQISQLSPNQRLVWWYYLPPKTYFWPLQWLTLITSE